MAIYYEEASAEYIYVLDIMNKVFTGIYTFEAIIKIWAYGY